jgi:hypothetical protein
MTSFEDHLWSHLLAHGADRAAQHRTPARSRRRPLVVLGGTFTALAAIAAALVLALTATTATPPAFAITADHDGTILITIRQVSDLAAINRRLVEVGAHARIVPFRQDCGTVLSLPLRYLQPNTQPWSVDNTGTGPVGSWTQGIIPSHIPSGTTFVFALAEYHHRGWESAGGFVKGSIPQCAALADLTLLIHGAQ